MGMIIREATAADDTAVGELLVSAFVTKLAEKLNFVEPSERLADLRDQAEKRANSTVLVAELNGTVIGTVALYPPGAARSEAWIDGAADLRLLAIAPAFQGRGVSNKLLDAAEDLARAWNVPVICLHTLRGASGVANLYRSRGYTRDQAGDIDHSATVYLEAHVLRLRPAERT
jgi:predicted N-acetyltransferase YhbS